MRVSKSQLSQLIENFLREQESEEEEKSEDKDIEFSLELSPNVTGDPSNKPREYTIKFFKDTDGKTNYKVNGQVITKDKQAFITLAGYGLLGDNEEISGTLESIVKQDYPELANYSKERIAELVKQKKDTSREPFSTDNLKKALGL